MELILYHLDLVNFRDNNILLTGDYFLQIDEQFLTPDINSSDKQFPHPGLAGEEFWISGGAYAVLPVKAWVFSPNLSFKMSVSHIWPSLQEDSAKINNNLT